MVETFDPNAIMVTITKKAAQHFLKYIQKKENATGIKITVKKTGCSGLAYVIEPAKEMPIGYIESIQLGIKLYIDQSAQSFLQGLEIDYEQKEMGLFQLVYNNPQEKARCGCGESFTV